MEKPHRVLRSIQAGLLSRQGGISWYFWGTGGIWENPAPRSAQPSPKSDSEQIQGGLQVFVGGQGVFLWDWANWLWLVEPDRTGTDERYRASIVDVEPGAPINWPGINLGWKHKRFVTWHGAALSLDCDPLVCFGQSYPW